MSERTATSDNKISSDQAANRISGTIGALITTGAATITGPISSFQIISGSLILTSANSALVSPTWTEHQATYASLTFKDLEGVPFDIALKDLVVDAASGVILWKAG